MSVSKTRKSFDRAAYLVSIFDAASEIGTATQRCVDLLRSVKLAAAPKLLESVAAEFRLGRICSYLGVKREAAIAIAAKTPFKEGATDTDSRRTHKEQMAWRAAVSGWSHIAYLAGMANARNGETRAAKKRATDKPATATATATATDKPASPAAIFAMALNKPADIVRAMPRMESQAEVIQRALALSTMMRADLDRSAGAPWGDLKPLFLDFVTKVKAIAAGATSTDKGESTKVVSVPVAAQSAPSRKALRRMKAIRNGKPAPDVDHTALIRAALKTTPQA